MKKTLRILALLTALVLGACLLTGCDSRPLPRAAASQFISMLETADGSGLARTVKNPGPVPEMLDPDAVDALTRKETKLVLSGLTCELGEVFGTYDMSGADMTLTNRDLKAVTEAMAAAPADLTDDERYALFEEKWNAEEETVTLKVSVTLSYSMDQGMWIFTLPEDFWTGALGGDPSLLPA